LNKFQRVVHSELFSLINIMINNSRYETFYFFCSP
jgi:hypothetical protein